MLTNYTRIITNEYHIREYSCEPKVNSCLFVSLGLFTYNNLINPVKLVKPHLDGFIF
jgi:hypothetical protein